MKEIILITGARGNLANVVKDRLSKKYTIRFLTTNKKLVNNNNVFYWNIDDGYINCKALENCNHIIHLAGYPIINRWTKKNKKIMFTSRVNSSELIFEKCKENNIKPKTFISASAIGYYGLNSKGIKSENDSKGKDWVADLVNSWEKSANNFNSIGCRVVNMRISLLISKKIAFLKYNILSVKFGIGMITGFKNRIFSWIHVDDVAKFIQNSIEQNIYSGVYNLATENNITELEFINILRKKYCSFAFIINVPNSLLKLILGERSKIINTNYSVSVKKLKENNFEWTYKKFNEFI